MPRIILDAEEVNKALSRGQGGGAFLFASGWYLATVNTEKVSDNVTEGNGWVRLDGFRFDVPNARPADGGDPRPGTVYSNLFGDQLIHLMRALGAPIEQGRQVEINTAAMNGREVAIRVSPEKRRDSNSNYPPRNRIDEFAPAATLQKRAG